MEKVKQHYEKIASQYDTSLQKWGYKDVIEEYITQANITLPENPHILDVGCGTGIALTKLKEMYPDAKITGLDISASMLGLCKTKISDVRLIQGDYNKQEFYDFESGEEFTFEPHSFDLIISTGSLTEYGNLKIVLPFLFSLLKPKGYLANIGHQKGIINWIVLLFWKGKSTSKKEFINKCIHCGFESAHSVPMSLGKNIWAWRKYCAVARTPEKTKVENFKLDSNSAHSEQKLETSVS
ncbi:class I SAM-dependent DNA methyltransferase [Candidatus Uabimicrobium amorphum]|uniref:O-methyltransferase n=1 Tax=Uabimicrobium amorphum TaxID=2596890 RepID=A0A5S9F6D6_UABAM|nr:class I SAM-dependent methyltransferase [Candidatus Uabimicrobium amorphum]BBM87785.1 O-methyltransferase [Candidatus Uabimicrobium amorphum]